MPPYFTPEEAFELPRCLDKEIMEGSQHAVKVYNDAQKRANSSGS